MSTSEAVAESIRELAIAFCEQTGVPGYVAGVYQDGCLAFVSHGVANIATGAPMRDDTGFLFGSVTKVLTSTLVFQQVERGAIDLDARVVEYLPEFTLAGDGASAASEIRVRNLLSHTNGIDADVFCPDVSGREALRVFVEELGRHCGSLFPAGELISYSNGGMNVAGRLLEVVTGTSYHDLLRRNLYAAAGMVDSCTSAEDAILRSTAVGHFPDPATGGVRRTDMFMLPDSWAPAGATPIGTVSDLLALGRTHLAGGMSPSGARVLAGESAARMRAVAHDMRTPNVPPMGLGWPLLPFGNTTVMSMSGASPGGLAILAVVPEHDLVFTAFGNDPRVLMLHDQVLLWLLREHLSIEVPALVPQTTPVDLSLSRYAGTYRSNQMSVQVSVVDGQLEEKATYEPVDEAQARLFSKFAGGSFEFPPRRLVPVREDLFAPAGMPPSTFDGYARMLLTSFHGVRDGRSTYRCPGGRMTRRMS
ncbi:MAG TPA: serine hydrolase domain-containing protein [Candidatus Dormibacteraeota bacterium]|nr:serine hydrolase domain-containing protein [Candidatus Dormibacteraeota bacterium]